MHLTLIVSHEYLHAKQKTITGNIRNRGNEIVQTVQLPYPPGMKVDSAEEYG